MAVAVIGCGLLAGCAPSPDSAANVGAVTFSSAQLAARTQEFLAETAGSTTPTAADQASVNRSVLTDEIRHQLIVVAAADKGIAAISDADVDAVVASSTAAALAQQLEVSVAQVPQAVRDALLLNALLKQMPAAGYPVQDVSVSAEGITTTSRDAAVAARSSLLNSSTAAAALAAAGSSALPAATYSMLGTPTKAAAGAAGGLFAAPAGQVIILGGGDSYVTFRLLSRTVAPGALTTAVLSQVSSQLPSFITLASLVLAPYAAQTNISVNPRFGVWDPVSLHVVPGDYGL